jgi:hypothetical protein
VKRTVIASTAVALLLALGAAGSVAAADGDFTPPPTTEESAAPTDEIAIDEVFVTPTPAATPVSEVLGATGRPQHATRTPPPTDALVAPASEPGSGLQMILLLGIAGSSLVLVAGRLPVARRR